MLAGYLIPVLLIGCCTLAALTSQQAGGTLGTFRHFLGFVVNEAPVLAGYWLAAVTALALLDSDLHGPEGSAAAVLAVLDGVGLAILAARAAPAAAVIDQALERCLGTSWHSAIGADSAAALTPRFQRLRLILPLLVRSPRVRRIHRIRYGPAGRAHLLDLYLSRQSRYATTTELRPILIHLHGGALRSGRRNHEGLPLIYRLASRGWVCISPNYRLRAAHWPDHLVDIKQVIAWVREHGPAYGGDPRRIVLAGGSSGAQLAAVAALSPCDPRFQPGFEDADTSVCAAIALYGHYGEVRRSDLADGALSSVPPASPLAYINPDAPPFFVVHGDRDPLLPAAAARAFADALRSRSRSAVVYAELPGAQHQFDMFHSVRCTATVNGIEAFAAWVLQHQADAGNITAAPSADK